MDWRRLASVRLLEGASTPELRVVAERMWTRRASPGDTLAKQGEAGETFSLVLEGLVEVILEPGPGATAPTVLAQVGPGGMLGELAVLRRRPRTATMRALEPSLLAVGDHGALDMLLAIPAVYDRVRRLAAARLARDLQPVRTALADGTPVLVRPLLPQDREVIWTELRRFSPESLRKRFFSPAPPSQRLLEYLIDIDYVDHFAWTVVQEADQRSGLAVGRFVRTGNPQVAEAAFGTAEGFHGRGLATLLLGALGVAALEGGISAFVAHVLQDNHAMRAVFAKAAPRVVFDEPGVLRLTMETSRAAELLEPGLRADLARAVHDIVTAASLALSDPSGAQSPTGRNPG